MQVNNVQLYGKTRREAVAFLREVPPPFTLVCCRRLIEEGTEYEPDDDEDDDDEWGSRDPTASLQEQVTHISVYIYIFLVHLLYFGCFKSAHFKNHSSCGVLYYPS